MPDEHVSVPVVELTREFMSCARCFERPCPVNGLMPLWPPRGWAGPGRLIRPVLVVVSLNPGHPLALADKYGSSWNETRLLAKHGLLPQAVREGEEVVRRALEVSCDAAREVLEFCWRSYSSPTRARDHLFHRRSVAYARACLWLMGVEPATWRDHCWFTDAVKCSTAVETNAGVPNEAIRECRSHLIRELKTTKPDLIAALGRQAGSAMRMALNEARSCTPVLVLRHPSRWLKLSSSRQMESFAGLEGKFARSPRSHEFRELLLELQRELDPPGLVNAAAPRDRP